MRIDVVMPKMGESIQEGKILKWVKNVGDKIDRDEVLLEISTDKVDTEVPAPNGGILVSILANVDDTVEVGKVIAVIETDASAATVSAPAPAAAVAPAPTPAVTGCPRSSDNTCTRSSGNTCTCAPPCRSGGFRWCNHRCCNAEDGRINPRRKSLEMVKSSRR
jgi:pyruvate/2-oxoglutarate dehydrogenase complex dihydrolipoamide acyltransferase (E2) component